MNRTERGALGSRKAKHKRVRLLLLALLFLVATWQPLHAQREPKLLTLEECIDYAREYSANALMARQTFLAAYWRYRSYRAELLPSLRFEGTLPSFNRSLSRYQLPDGSYKYIENNASTLEGALLLSQRIGWTGTRLFLRTSAERHDLLGKQITTDYMTTPVLVGLEHSVFGINDLKWKRKIEPKRYEEEKRVYLQNIEKVTQEAIDLFFNLLFAQQRLSIARMNRANADTLYRIAKGRYNIGTIAENDLLQVELDLLNQTNSVSEGELSLQNAQFQLLTFLGLKESYDLHPLPPKPYVGDTLNYSQVLELARQNNPTPLRLQIQKLEVEQEVAAAKSERGIQLNVSASYGLTQQASTYWAAYQNPLDQQGVSLNVSIPIIDWGQGAGRLKIARSNRELAEVRTQKALREFEQQVFLQVMRYNRLSDMLRIASKADTIAQNRFNITKQRFLIGKIGVLDLDNAQGDRDNARMNFWQAIRNSWISYYELRELTLFDPETNQSLPFDFQMLLK